MHSIVPAGMQCGSPNQTPQPYAQYGGTPIRMLVNITSPYSPERAEVLDLLLEHGANPHLVEQDYRESIADTLTKNKHGFWKKEWIDLFEKKGIITRPATATGSAPAASLTPAPGRPSNISLPVALANPEAKARKGDSVSLRKIDLAADMGTSVSAWSTPDDGTTFNSERAREILSRHISPLGYKVTGCFVGGDWQDPRSHCYFYMYEQSERK